jgi:uncharacterized protein
MRRPYGQTGIAASEAGRRPPFAVTPVRGVSHAGLSDAGSEKDHVLDIAGTTLLADPAGALYWPDEKLLAVADLHLEKGSAFAVRGVLLPPYDTAATLARLAKLIERYRPGLVVALGDSFHDGGGPARMVDVSRAALAALQRGRDWLWIAGNHDPDLPRDIGGRVVEVLSVGSLIFRHEPSLEHCDGEIAGHLHPIARVARRGRGISSRALRATASVW